ncbi:MAG: topoisomerase protein [candidate division WS6 bacterium GW2011_GWA2_37_6]|uniref:DNA topoisomerase 1 n=1 Tax=candidate division WS6 bacterium GW2011_GWA2_37_6 TaxID=1619087 RepID=A0A0G0K3K6_9BACT|nr:MAG: topoisomerase protein [candidate division WS6 bacterium GW2011_GWA2_37_6]
MSKLVVVESPSKEHSIKKYLGSGYEVKASKGHIADLPKKELGVDVDADFEPEYIITNQKSLTALKKAFKGKTTLILAVDPDREGEAIGWHVAQRLGVISASGKTKKGKKLERFVFTEITGSAVQRAAQNPRKIDMNLVNAQQTRRILDRLVGYKLSPLLWKKVRFGLSAGRVQSVAVKLVVDKERERDKFKSQEFWNIDSYLDKKQSTKKTEVIFSEIDKDEKSEILEAKIENAAKKEKTDGIKFKLVKISGKKAKINNKSEAQAVLHNVKGKEWIINDVETSTSVRRPSPPFKTSTLQQFAVNKLGFSAKRTMQVAQKLYEAGLITYMRTDSISMSGQAINDARKFLQNKYGPEYLPEKPNFFATRSKVAQEAHEAIRPTKFANTADKIKAGNDERKLYDLIYKKALSSQASNASVELTNVSINISKYLFEAKGQRILFPGFLKILSDLAKEEILPKLMKGDQLFPKTIVASQNFTQPPARYTEATLIKALEKYGIGRPSTYSTIISTIQSRQYVIKEQKYFIPTDTGFIVTKLLEDHFPEIVDLGFTAEMEEDLDAIANGKKEWVKTIKEFYGPFAKTLKIKETKISREDYNILGEAPKKVKCPECESKMMIKLGRYGRFYSCSKWPKCKGMLSIGENSKDDLEKQAKSTKFLGIYESAPKTEDGRDYLLKFGKFGKFWAHPDYPKVKDARPLEYKTDIKRKIYGNTPKAEDGKKMVLRKGRFGEFWAHPDYPKIKEFKSINKKLLKLKKKELGVE